jgi:hypothetical protein
MSKKGMPSAGLLSDLPMLPSEVVSKKASLEQNISILNLFGAKYFHFSHFCRKILIFGANYFHF